MAARLRRASHRHHYRHGGRPAPVRSDGGGRGTTRAAPRSNRAREHPRGARVSSTTPCPETKARATKEERTFAAGSASRKRGACLDAALVVGIRRAAAAPREDTTDDNSVFLRRTRRQRTGRFEGRPFFHRRYLAHRYPSSKTSASARLLCMTRDARDGREIQTRSGDADAPRRTYVRTHEPPSL